MTLELLILVDVQSKAKAVALKIMTSHTYGIVIICNNFLSGIMNFAFLQEQPMILIVLGHITHVTCKPCKMRKY